MIPETNSRSYIQRPPTSGGSGFTNPYEAIAGLNSVFMPDAPALVQDTSLGPSVCAVQSQSALVTVPLLMRPDPSSAPTLATFNGSKKGFAFDGTSTQFAACWAPNDDVVDDAGSMTLFAIIKTTISGAVGLAGIFARGVVAGRWRIAITNGFAQFNVVNNVGAEFMAVSDAVVNDGQIHNLIAHYDPANSPGATVTLYVDGVLQASSASTPGPLQTIGEPVAMGAIVAPNYTGSFPYTGLIRDVGSYNRALRGEVAALNAIMNARQ